MIATTILLAITATGAIVDPSFASDKPSKPAVTKPVTSVPVAPTTIAIEVNKIGFVPNTIQIKKNTPVNLVFTRTTDSTCAKEVILQLGNGKTIKKMLPLNAAVEISATFTQTGELSYACKMDMITGTISVQ
jgi:plastocyanin domain-containing protein